MILRTRRQMAHALEQVMSHAYAEQGDAQRLDAESTLLKTYLLEAHTNSGSHDSTIQLLRSAFGIEYLGTRVQATVHESDEEAFFTVVVRLGRDAATYHVDASDRRYWVVHSASKSTPSDRILQTAVFRHPQLDTVWLPMQLLERVSGLGSFRGLGLDFDRRTVPEVEFEGQAAPVESLKMQLWGNRADEVFRVLREHSLFSTATTLSKVKVKYWLDRLADEDAFTLDDVKYDGKITARGTSFQSHISLVSNVSRNYSERIKAFEEKFSLELVADQQGRGVVSGEPLMVVFSRPIQDMEVFLDRVFSGANPFRLSGIPVRVSPYMYRVVAIDLHINQSLTFEVTPDYMRVYLRKGCCGNTAARLYTNLQHHYDSLVEMTSTKGVPVFEA